MNILTFLDSNIEMLCLLHLNKDSYESSFKNHSNKAIISCQNENFNMFRMNERTF